MPDTIIPEDDDFFVVMPAFSASGLSAIGVPVIGWRVEGHADTGRLIPVTDDEAGDEAVAHGKYILQLPDGSLLLPNGERCDGLDDLNNR